MTPIKRISREPTEEEWIEMLDSGWNAYCKSKFPAPYNQLRDAFQAMFDAAPDSESEAEKKAKDSIRSYDAKYSYDTNAFWPIEYEQYWIEIVRALLDERWIK